MTTTANDLLKATARSFYLSLRMLPAAVRPQSKPGLPAGARTTDTIADTEIVPRDQRLEALQRLREHILGRAAAPLEIAELARHQGSPAEKLLLEKGRRDIAWPRCKPCPSGTANCREVLATITEGQALDVRRFAQASSSRIAALETAAELDEYTYHVAGCVGGSGRGFAGRRFIPPPRSTNRN